MQVDIFKPVSIWLENNYDILMWFHDSQKMSLIKILNMSIGNRCMKPFMNACFYLHIWIVDLRRQGSVYQKIFWTRPISNFSISRPKGREIEIGDQSLVQKIFRYTDPIPLRSTHWKFLRNSSAHLWSPFLIIGYCV